MSVTKINYAPKRIGMDDISTSSLQEFRDRTIKSRIWPSIQPYVDLSFCNLSTLLHMNQLFATLETCVFLVFQLKSNASSHYRTSGLKTIGHRYIFGEILPSFSFASASFQVAEAVFDILFVTQVLLLVASAYLVMRVKKEPIRKSDGSKSISWLLSQVLVIKNALVLGPITEVATLVIKYSNHGWAKGLGAISLLLLPLETLIHCCLTYEYGFITTNKIQGRGYAFFFVRSIGLIFVTILRTAWEGHRTDASDLLINLISLALSLSLVYMQITQNIYYWSPSLEKVSTFALSLYSWECFTILLLTLWPDVISDFDLDYQTVIMMPLIFWAERNLLTSHRSKVGNLGSHLGHRTAADGVFYLELLYGAFRNFKDEENAFMVGSSLSRHTLACKDPLCLCFFLRSNVDINSGFDAGKSARELAHKSLFADKKNSAELKEGAVESSGFGKLCTIGLPDVISNYKSKHFKVASIEINHDRSAIKVVESEFKSDSDKMGFILTLQEPTSYLATILGFFRSLILDHAKGNNLDAVIGFLRFAIGEYGSCICALLVLYEYIYSSDYTRHSSTTADFLLINLMQQARRKLAEEDSENRPALEGKTLTQVLSLRKRVQTVVKRTMDGIIGKRDMYEELVNQRGEADTAYEIGQAQQINQTFLEGEFAELLAHRVPNIDLLKAAIHFQMFVLEKKSTPRSLLKRFKELTQDYLHRTTYDPVDGIPVLRHASPFASDHVVVLARYTNNSYRISHFTENAQELFCSESRERMSWYPTDLSLYARPTRPQ